MVHIAKKVATNKKSAKLPPSGQLSNRPRSTAIAIDR
jgi:hypothetical protein